MDGLKTTIHLLSCRWSLWNSSIHFFSAVTFVQSSMEYSIEYGI